MFESITQKEISKIIKKLGAKNKNKLSKKDKYILKYYKETLETKKITSIDLDLEDFYYDEILKDSKIKGISIEQNIILFFYKLMIKINKKKFLIENKNKFNDFKIIDIFDFRKIEKLIDKKEKYLVITLEEPIVILPIEDSISQMIVNGTEISKKKHNG